MTSVTLFSLASVHRLDEPNAVVSDVDVLHPASAALVRRFRFDSFDQFVQDVAIQLFNLYGMVFQPLNELLHKFILLFLYRDFFPEPHDFDFQLLLLGFVGFRCLCYGCFPPRRSLFPAGSTLRSGSAAGFAEGTPQQGSDRGAKSAKS